MMNALQSFRDRRSSFVGAVRQLSTAALQAAPENASSIIEK